MFVYTLFSVFHALRQKTACGGGIVQSVRDIYCTFTEGLHDGCTERGTYARHNGKAAARGAQCGAAVAGRGSGGRRGAGRGLRPAEVLLQRQRGHLRHHAQLDRAVSDQYAPHHGEGGRQREYFIKRYYYLDDTIDYNIKHEKKISSLFNGKGIAKYRFEFYKIPKTSIAVNKYIPYLDYLNEYFLDYISEKDGLADFPDMSKVSNIVLIAEKQYYMAKYSIPASLIILLCFFIVFLIAF